MSGYQLRAPAAGAFTRPALGVGVRRPLAAVGRWVMLLVALTGLMAMHGLSDHGIGGLAGTGLGRAGASVAGATTPTHMAERASPSGHADQTAGAAGQVTFSEAAGGHAHGSSSAPSGESSGGHGGHGELLVGLCLAVLVALLLFAVLVRGVRIVGVLVARLVDVAGAAVAAVRARARGPARPDLRVLSIQRC